MKSPSVLIRVIRGGFFFLLLGLCAASAAELTIVRVFTGWRDASSFKHVSEYFSGKENTHGETMLRTRPDVRSGYYFLVRTDNPGAPLAVKIGILLNLPGESKPRTHTFAVDVPSGQTVLNLGLTGADWPDAKTNPVAWKLDVLAPDGRVLTTEKSYLWEKPAEN